MARLLLLLLPQVLHLQVLADRASFDCSMRSLAVEFAASTNPSLSAAALQRVADALNGSPEKTPGCNVTVPPALAQARARPELAGPPLTAEGQSFYVDFVKGSDGNSGSVAAPFKTVTRAQVATRAMGAGSSMVLRGGTHFLAAPLVLDARDAGLTMQSYPGEAAWLSRGTPLSGIAWKPYNTSASNGSWAVYPGQNAVWGATEGPTFHLYGNTPDAPTCAAACAADLARGGRCTIYTWHDANQAPYALNCWFRLDGVLGLLAESGHTSGAFTPPQNVWSADLSSLPGLPQDGSVHGLRGVDGARLIRARYPNADPEQGFGSGLRASSWTAPQATQHIQPTHQYRPAQPYRNSSYSFEYYQGGWGGICAVPGFGFFETPGSMYWCGNQTEGGGAFTWRTPYGMQVDSATLPHLPYADTTGAVVQAWHPAHWASRMYLLDGRSQAWDAATRTANMSFVAGGFQDARGSDDAGEFYIENVWEELDAPSEWFFNETTRMLYLNYNASSGTPPPADGSLVAIAAGASALIIVNGSSSAPVPGLSFLSLGFRDTSYVYFDPHSIPSGGDWALPRSAAVFLEGSEGATVQSCLFERLDGTALMLSGYNRNSMIDSNDFSYIGGSAMVAWGRTTGDPTGADGPDGTNGDQPRYSVFKRNVGREIGIWEKQSSLLMQAKTSDSLVVGNVGFNGPRAGINQNGAQVKRNPDCKGGTHVWGSMLRTCGGHCAAYVCSFHCPLAPTTINPSLPSLFRWFWRQQYL